MPRRGPSLTDSSAGNLSATLVAMLGIVLCVGTFFNGGVGFKIVAIAGACVFLFLIVQLLRERRFKKPYLKASGHWPKTFER